MQVSNTARLLCPNIHEDRPVLIENQIVAIDIVPEIIASRTVSDSFAFNVGPVPTVKDPSRVRVTALIEMARRNGDSGTFDMEVGNLTAETAMDALERSEAAAVFLDSGTVVALFYHDGLLDSALYFAPTQGEGGANGNDREEEPDEQQQHRKNAVCNSLYFACIADPPSVTACIGWLENCQTTPIE